MPFPGDRAALAAKDDVAAYLESYAARFALPIAFSSPVASVEHDGAQFVVRTLDRTLTAPSLIIATGVYHRPYVPAFAGDLSPSIVGRHSSHYTNPGALPPGDVLVLGAGNSGAQIALELARTRRVFLSGRTTGAIPRRLLGRDVYDWLWPTLMRPTIDSRLGRRLMQGRLFAGDPLIGISARDLAQPSLTRVGRTVGVRDGQPLLDDGRTMTVNSVIWCTGFRPDFSWIRLPVFGADGYPVHRRGLVAGAPMLAFVGLRYQYRVGSSLLGGVGEDAEFVVRALTEATRRAA
jgi:putative flavoprotein involved in K+ transport